jgi:hypothetical protein
VCPRSGWGNESDTELREVNLTAIVRKIESSLLIKSAEKQTFIRWCKTSV